MAGLSTRHLLGIKDLNRADIELIFETADNFKTVLNRPIKKVPSLRDVTIANIFFENSTRTRLSFELAEKRLSADVINFAASSSSVSKGETLIDTVNNILAMKVDMVVMRHPYAGAGIFLSKHVKAQIVNAGDGAHEHPTQALLDAFSIREKLGDVAGKKVVNNSSLIRQKFDIPMLTGDQYASKTWLITHSSSLVLNKNLMTVTLLLNQSDNKDYYFNTSFFNSEVNYAYAAGETIRLGSGIGFYSNTGWNKQIGLKQQISGTILKKLDIDIDMTWKKAVDIIRTELANQVFISSSVHYRF